MRTKVILKPSAAIRPHFTISYCDNHSTLLGSQTLKPCGEHIYACMYCILPNFKILPHSCS